MISRSFQSFLINTIAFSVLMSVLLSPISGESDGLIVTDGGTTANSELKIPFTVSQDNETTNTTTTTTTTTTISEDTNTTSTSGLSAWRPLIDDGLYYPFALIFSILGILSTIWLIFFVETSKDRTIRERLIGTTIRLVIMSIFIGLGIHFWILFEPI